MCFIATITAQTNIFLLEVESSTEGYITVDESEICLSVENDQLEIGNDFIEIFIREKYAYF